MKTFLICLILFLLCGCQTNGRDPSKQPLSLSQQKEWTEEKGYIQKLVSLQKDVDQHYYKYSYEMTDEELILTSAKSTLTYELASQTLHLERNDEFYYVKNNEIKNGTLMTVWTENNKQYLIEGTFSNGTDTYPIAFDLNTMTITDHEEGSKTYGQPMKFMQAVKDRIIHEMIQTYNQLSLQKQVLSYWHNLTDSVFSEKDIAKLPEASEISLDTSTLLESTFKRESITTEALIPRVISIDEDFFISLWDASALEKTLFIAAHIASEFNSAEEIDWNQVLVPVLGISENLGGCEGLECILHQEPVYLDYSTQNGYLSLGHLDDLNHTVHELSGIKEVYLPQSDQSLTDHALYDAQINAYLVWSPDGEFVNRDPGIILLNQSTSENQMIYELVIYTLENDDTNQFVSGMMFGQLSEFTNEYDRMMAAYQTVLANLDAFDHWKLVLEKQEDGQLYKLISMHKTN